MKNKHIKFHRLRSCKYKIKYASLKVALIKLFHYRDNKGLKVNCIYKCLFCENYHIGHQSKNTRKTMRKVLKLMTLTP